MIQPQWQNGGFPQQGGWQGGYSPYVHELPEPEDTTPPHREGYERMSSRIFVTPAEASSADIVSELAESHGLVIQEKSITSLRPVDWPDEATFSAEINRILKVKAGKSGAKFWKGVREAVMKQCTTHDLVLVFQSPGMEAEEAGELHLGQVTSLIKNVLEAADTKAAADSIVGLKSGSVLAVLVGWTSDEVSTWSVVSDDPIQSSNSRQHQQWASRNYQNDLQDYSDGHAQSMRQVPPRQRLGYQRPPPWQQGQPQPYHHQQQAYRQGGYGGMQPMLQQQQYGYPQGPPQMMQGGGYQQQQQQHGMQQYMGNSGYGGQGNGMGPGGAGHPGAGGAGYGGYGGEQPGFQAPQQERPPANYDPSGMSLNAAVFVPGAAAQQNAPPSGMHQGGMHQGGMRQGGMQQQGMQQQGMQPQGNGVGGGMHEQVAAPARQMSMEDAALRAAAESLWAGSMGGGPRPPAAAPPAAAPSPPPGAAPFMIPSSQPGLASLEMTAMQAAAGQLWSGMAPAAALPESAADDLDVNACLGQGVASAMGLDGGSSMSAPRSAQTMDGANELLAKLSLNSENQRLPGFDAPLPGGFTPPSLPPSAPTSRPPSREEEALAALERHAAFDFEEALALTLTLLLTLTLTLTLTLNLTLTLTLTPTRRRPSPRRRRPPAAPPWGCPRCLRACRRRRRRGCPAPRPGARPLRWPRRRASWQTSSRSACWGAAPSARSCWCAACTKAPRTP